MTKDFYILLILIFISTNVYSYQKRSISISDSVHAFEIFYKEKKHNRTQLISIQVLDKASKNKYDIRIKKPAIFAFNSYIFSNDNLFLQDYDNNGINELLITNVNQNTDNNSNQLLFEFCQSDMKYHEINNFRQLKSPQLNIGLNKIKEFNFWGNLNVEKYYSIKDNTINLDSTIVSEYTFDSKGIKINHKVYFKNAQREYIEELKDNISFNLEDTIETIPIKLTHKNFLLNLYFDKEKILNYLIVRNNSNQVLIKLNCKSVGIYLPMQNVIYDSLAYINQDFDFNNDGILDFIFPSTQYGDLYLFLIDQSTNQLYINPRIQLGQNTFYKEGNTLITRRRNPCGTLPREYTKYTYSIYRSQFSLISQTDVIEYRKRKKIFSLEKTYIFDGIDIKQLKTINRKTKLKM